MINEHDIEAFMDMQKVPELPILFQAEMVRAVLDDRKTQTRRTNKLDEVNENPNQFEFCGFEIGTDGKLHALFADRTKDFDNHLLKIKCPFGNVGHELWVKETFREWDDEDFGNCGCSEYCLCPTEPPSEYCYRADGYELSEEERENGLKWKPSIFMNRQASRTQLRITDIRVERLQDISGKDAKAEGLLSKYIPTDGFTWYGHDGKNWTLGAKNAFKTLWQSINGADSWDSNPFVWVVEFERIKP